MLSLKARQTIRMLLSYMSVNVLKYTHSYTEMRFLCLFLWHLIVPDYYYSRFFRVISVVSPYGMVIEFNVFLDI